MRSLPHVVSTPAAGLPHGDALSAVDQFLQSTRDALRPHANTGQGALIALVCVLVLGLTLWCLHNFRRKQAADRAFMRLMTARQISGPDATLLRQMARAAKITPLRMATQLDAFERATATAVQDIPPKLIGEEADVLGAIRLLRRHLGFSKLPEHFSLRTTRELTPEMPIEIQGAQANVIGVTEAFFSVRAPAVRGLRVGDRVELTLAHAQEARYAVRCELLAAERSAQEGPTDVKLTFGHDESPRRLQRREFVRVAARGPMVLAREGAPATAFRPVFICTRPRSRGSRQL